MPSTMSFNEIPQAWRVPLVWCEIDPSRAANFAPAMPYRGLILGHGGAFGGAPLAPKRVTSAAQAAKLFGPASLLAAQAKGWFAANTTTEVFYLPVAEPAGSRASLTLTFGGAADEGGVIYLYVGNSKVRAYVPAGADGADAAEALHNALRGGPWAASLGAEGALAISAPHNGAYANGVMVRLGYYQGEELPSGLSCSFAGAPEPYEGSPTPDYEISAALAGLVAFHAENDPARPLQSLVIPGMFPPKPGLYGRLHGGSGAPDLMEALSALDDKTQYHLIVSPWTDGGSLAVLKDLAADRWKALVDMPAQIIAAAGGTHTDLGELGDRHNSHHITLLGTGGPFTAQENNLLLYDGISTWYEGADGECRVQRLITTYKTNAWGAEDMAFLDLNTPLTLTYLRYAYKVWMAKRFPRHKLASDGTHFGYGQAIATPKMIKGETLAWFTEMERLGLVEDADQFKRELIVERNPDDPCRVDVYLPPNIVNQLRVLAVQIGFRL